MRCPQGVDGSRATSTKRGDAHISNFGGFAAPDRRLVFGPNDFDETLPGPWEWDVKRMAASVEFAGRDVGFPAGRGRSKVMVRDANGAEIGQIVQKNFGFTGKFRFVLESGGQPLGSMNAEDWNAWDFNIQDATGNEIARITKALAGLAKEWFTTGDSHVVQIHRSLDEPLRSLVIAAALGVDTALMQDRGQSGARSRRARKSKGWGWDGGDDGDG